MMYRISIYKIGFLFLALSLCAILALRHIPSFYDINDSGRYVAWIESYCLGEEGYYEDKLESPSYQLFYSVATLNCTITEPHTFLFIVALFTPLPFVLFSRGGCGNFMWSLTFFLSVFSLELMTNALRQSLGLMLFMFSLALIKKSKLFAFVILIVSIFSHPSVAIYSPLFIVMAYNGFVLRVLRHKPYMFLFFSLVVLFLGVISNYSLFWGQLNFYQSIYMNSLNLSFVLYVTFPVFFVWFTRYVVDYELVSFDERFCFFYSLFLIVVTLVFFPAITYRVVFLTFPIYIFIISREGVTKLSGLCACIGLVIHMSVMMLFSSNRILY
ncbi:EpsG family protein [Shewanella loihica]|nr:EpsG family protein [Shewanella loihica]